MSSIWVSLLSFLLILLWVVTGGYVTQANVYISPYRKKDSQIKLAYDYSYWAAFITWFIVGVFVILIILSVLGIAALFGSGVGEVGAAAEAGEAGEAGGQFARYGGKLPSLSITTLIFLGGALGLVITTGVLAALAADTLVKSPAYDSSNRKLAKARENLIIAAVASLGTVGVLIAALITYLAVERSRKEKFKEELKKREEPPQEELPK